MFGKNRQKPSGRIDTLIGADTVIDGNIRFGGGLRVDGSIKGNVLESAPQSGTLILSEHGRIDGAIQVSHAVINGSVNGPVTAHDYVELQAKSRVTGDVNYKAMEIHMGAVVEGKLIPMDAPVAETASQPQVD